MKTWPFKIKNKKFLIFFISIILILFIYLFFKVSNIVKEGYDKQSKIVEITKLIIPNHYIKKIKENLFFVSNLKARNDYLEIQVKKFEQGLKGEKFKSE